jgi:integrase
LKVTSFDDLRQAHVAKYRSHVGLKSELERSTRNRWMSGVSLFLGWAIPNQYVPFLTTEAVRAALPRYKLANRPLRAHEHAEIRTIFEAAERHDEAVLADEEGVQPYLAMPLVIGTMFGCMRIEEATLIVGSDFQDKAVLDGKRVGRIDIRPDVGKGGEPREIYLDHTPLGARYFRLCKSARKPDEPLLGVPKYWMAAKVMQDMRNHFGAPPSFTWQKWRRTSDCYLCSAPHIFGAAAHIQASERLGHKLTTMQMYYTRAVAGISKDATTLEQALGVEDLLNRACASFAMLPASAALEVVGDIDRSTSRQASSRR